MIKRTFILLTLCLTLFYCKEKQSDTVLKLEETKEIPFIWEGANVYFLLTDRFNNANPSNDVNYNRDMPTGKLRGFEGGDIKGVTQKIEEGYFDDLGVNAIWFSPVMEQIHGATDEGTGLTYAFHGYWIKDWTSFDANYGTSEDLADLVKAAHEHGIRVLLDAVINHTGPVTEKDPVWPNDWVRTEPQCTYDSYEHTVSCTLVKNLPDVLTESNENVELPPQLVEKWQTEGRYEQEMAELDAFFERTGYPRAPRYYIIKWLTDYITEFGVDGFRVDTVKHTESYVWQELRVESDYAFSEWKKNNPDKVLDDTGFYMVGEVYNYGISSGLNFDFGDKKVDFFDKAFNSLINFEVKWNAAQMSYEAMFAKYSDSLNGPLKDYGVLNYMSSHDDGQPFDQNRKKPYETANRLLLCPGTSQIYYGDETARPLQVEDAVGDANLRSFMNWSELDNPETKQVLEHWQKLGRFRHDHPSVGAGVHKMISSEPYVFSRTYSNEYFQDKVIVGLDLPSGEKVIDVSTIFKNGTKLKEAYSGQETVVVDGKVSLESEAAIMLLEAM